MRRLIVWAVLTLIVIALLFAAYNRGHCAYTGWQLDRDTRYAPLVGCLVKSNDGWLPLQQIRDIE